MRHARRRDTIHESASLFFRGLLHRFFSSPAKRLIIVNDSFSLQNQRFSVAHEIGHIVLTHGSADLLQEGLNIEWGNLQEIYANMFATELLMPYDALSASSRMTPEGIADACNVPLWAAYKRHREMGWESP